MLGNAFVEPWFDVILEVFVGDAFQVDDRNRRDVFQPERNEPAVVEPAELVLKSVPDPRRTNDRRSNPLRCMMRAKRYVVVSASSVPSTSTNATLGGTSNVGQSLTMASRRP